MHDTSAQTAVPVSDYAIIVNEKDNVAVVKNENSAGLVMQLPWGDHVALRSAVPPGHRFATRDIPAGEFVRQYGQPIGTSLGIEKGDWIRHENMTDDVPVIRDLSEDLHNPAPDYFEIGQTETFMGADRPDVDVC
jgi:altronate hydrolase